MTSPTAVFFKRLSFEDIFCLLFFIVPLALWPSAHAMNSDCDSGFIISFSAFHWTNEEKGNASRADALKEGNKQTTINVTLVAREPEFLICSAGVNKAIFRHYGGVKWHWGVNCPGTNVFVDWPLPDRILHRSVTPLEKPGCDHHNVTSKLIVIMDKMLDDCQIRCALGPLHDMEEKLPIMAFSSFLKISNETVQEKEQDCLVYLDYMTIGFLVGSGLFVFAYVLGYNITLKEDHWTKNSRLRSRKSSSRRKMTGPPGEVEKRRNNSFVAPTGISLLTRNAVVIPAANSYASYTEDDWSGVSSQEMEQVSSLI